MMMKEGRRRRGHDELVRSDRDRGERRGSRQGDREDESEGWSVRSDETSDEETEEDGMTTGEQEGIEETLKALPWGAQESRAGGLQVGARASKSDNRKAPYTTADEAGTQGRHGARQGQG